MSTTEYHNHLSPSLIVGIDPDVTKSGVAVWNFKIQKFEQIIDLDFWDLIGFLLDNNEAIREVRIEAGWLNSSNFHLNQIRNGKKYVLNNREAASAGLDLGHNQLTGKLIVTFCQKYNIPYKEIKPLLKNWWKNDGKKFKATTGWTGQTNPEKRDAAMLVYGLQ